ncbi:MAG TPA: UDP-N-acetylmuramate dehydrogenase [Acidimicrobiales bacterium]|nr:UDP-N-acetylmuramate dehydrogenase [Acidimicrobiales bacterium]
MSRRAGAVPTDARVAAAAAALGDRAARDRPLGPLTTYKVGGPAALFATVDTAADLAAVAAAVAGSGVPTLVVGKGSNLLVADRGFAGLAVVLGGEFAEVAIEGTTVVAGGAAALPVVARQTVRAGLTGFEWAVGVPGSVGGGVRMNAGGHGSDMAASVVEATVVDLATASSSVVPAAGLVFGYRRSSVTPSQVVTSATLALAVGDRTAGERLLSEVVAWRRAHQPGGQNAGSVFTNPPGDSAGRLIDVSGAKGLRHGTAAVSTKHANFFQADPGGSADDVRALMDEVRARVRAHTGVDLVPETRMVGFDEPSPEVEVER